MGLVNFVQMVYDNMMYAKSQRFQNVMGKIVQTGFSPHGDYYMRVVDQKGKMHLVFAPTSHQTLWEKMITYGEDRTFRDKGYFLSLAAKPGDYVDLTTYKHPHNPHHHLLNLETYATPDFMRTKPKNQPPYGYCYPKWHPMQEDIRRRQQKYRSNQQPSPT